MWRAAVTRAAALAAPRAPVSAPAAAAASTWRGDACVPAVRRVANTRHVLRAPFHHRQDRKTNVRSEAEQHARGSPDEAHDFERRARREGPPGAPQEDTYEELPLGYHCRIYDSPESGLIRALGGLMAVNGVAAAGAALLSLQTQLTALYEVLQAAEGDSTSPVDFMLATSMPLPDFSMPLILLGISGGMFKLATAGLKRVCIGLDRVIDDAGAEVIDVQHMTLRGSGTRRYAREDCEGSRDTRVSQNFAVLDTRRGGPAVYYLFPVGGWWSDDLPYLKTFLYEKFFRVEKPPPPDEALIAIEGFGPFRPAALADPEHAAARRLPWPVAPAALTDTPYFVKEGHVYAEFPTPAPRSAADARTQELAEKVFRDPDVAAARAWREGGALPDSEPR